MRKMPCLFVLFFVFCTFTARDSFAVIYKYVDRNGVICYSDDLQSVPETYRPKAVIVSGELKGEPKLTAGREDTHDERFVAAPPVGGASLPTTRKEKPFSRRVANTIIMMTILVVIYVVLDRLKEVIESKNYVKAVHLARIGLTAVAVLYLVFAHVDDVVRAFGAAGTKVEEVKKQSEKKGKNAAKAFKSLDELTEAVYQAQKTPHPESEKKE